MTRVIRICCIALLTIVGLVGSSLPVQADDRDRDRGRDSKCEKRIHQAEEKLRNAVQRHGEGSRQAQKRREELEEARRHCGDHHDRDHHDGDRDRH